MVLVGKKKLYCAVSILGLSPSQNCIVEYWMCDKTFLFQSQNFVFLDVYTHCL